MISQIPQKHRFVDGTTALYGFQLCLKQLRNLADVRFDGKFQTNSVI
jgi:hypothetical protein